MNRYGLIGIMLLLFMLEGTIVPWLVPVGFGDRIVPHFVFAFVLFAGLYGSRYMAFGLGIGFGLLQDIVYYGHLMGVHTFLMGLLGYTAGLLAANKRITLVMALAIIGLATFAYDSGVYFIYSVFRISTETYDWAIIDHIAPSLFLQLVFALVFYIPARRWFERIAPRQKSGEEE